MTDTKPVMKMPELLVLARFFVTGLIGAEVGRGAFYLGTNFVPTLSNVAFWVQIVGVLLGALLCLIYAVSRNAHVIVARIGRSRRIDLLATVGIGIWTNELASPWLDKAHATLKHADPHWAPTVFLLLSAVLFSPLFQHYLLRPKKTTPQLYFIADEEIEDEKEDLLASKVQAKSFAETVLASGAHTGLVFGVDGAWGVGKTTRMTSSGGCSSISLMTSLALPPKMPSTRSSTICRATRRSRMMIEDCGRGRSTLRPRLNFQEVLIRKRWDGTGVSTGNSFVNESCTSKSGT